MSAGARELMARILRFARIFVLGPRERRFLREARRSGLFDAVYYRGAYPQIHPLFHRFPLRHYIVFGEGRGYRPNPDFSPRAYLRLNPDVADDRRLSPFYHYITAGRAEGRPCKDLPEVEALPAHLPARSRFRSLDGPRARFAVVVHVYYADLWPEFADRLRELDIDADLFVTLTYRDEDSTALAERIREEFPRAHVRLAVNRGRDILPFLALVNEGSLDGYEAVCKIHTKKSPHRADGDRWRQHLVEGILPRQGLPRLLETFLGTPDAAIWVADGQHYEDRKWWGTNFETTRHLLRRVEIEIGFKTLSFPAGSMYWLNPLMIAMLRAMHLSETDFEEEKGQVDGTRAHAMERAMGFLATAAEQRVYQTSELESRPAAARPAPPALVSAFYLPQFHPIPENDEWWGKGFTEWRGVVTSRPAFEGHTQPFLPADLGFYDLRLPDVMAEQARLARAGGVDAFCVYHYWFGGRRVLEAPLDNLLDRPEIDFPFYLCWANESWRRNWDGLSGTVLLEQDYAPGFETALAQDALPYMRDPRYLRPDGTRPRFVIYRPEDMPDPAGSVARMRAAWREAGIGEVELGAVRFHIEGEHPVAVGLFDFWIEMPPHGLVSGPDYLVGGPGGTRLEQSLAPGFAGLVYDYPRLAETSCTKEYVSVLPENTICGVMPGWDNTARRGLEAHVAYGANPAAFFRWLMRLENGRLGGSYRRELFVNAWNEWGEKAVLEPSLNLGNSSLEVLAGWKRREGDNQGGR